MSSRWPSPPTATTTTTPRWWSNWPPPGPRPLPQAHLPGDHDGQLPHRSRPGPVPGPRHVRTGGARLLPGAQTRSRRDRGPRTPDEARSQIELAVESCPTRALSIERRIDNAVTAREVLEDFVERWLEANRVAEAKGDWKGLADFYTDDATYGWNIGPKEDVMCVGIEEIRERRARSGDVRPGGLELPVSEGDHRRQDRRGRRLLEAGGKPTPTATSRRSTASAAAGSGLNADGERSNGSATSSTSATCRSCTLKLMKEGKLSKGCPSESSAVWPARSCPATTRWARLPSRSGDPLDACQETGTRRLSRG